MDNQREHFVAAITASMTHDITANELLRYRVFPGLMPDAQAYGWTEAYYCCANVAAAFITELTARHGSLQAFWDEYVKGIKYEQGVFYYDAAAVLLDEMSRVGGTSTDYQTTVLLALDRFTIRGG